MSDQKEDIVNEESYQVDSDQESSNVRYHGAVTQHVIQKNLDDSGSSQFVNLKDGNEAVAFDSIEAPVVAQTKEIRKEGYLMPHGSVRAHVNELPRNNEQKENSTLAAPSRPSKRRYRRSSTSRISINAQAAEDGGLRRSSRIKERNDANNVNHDPYEDPYLFKKRPLYMERKKDVYAYPGFDSEDDEWY